MSEFEAFPTPSQHFSDSDSVVLYLCQDAPAYQLLHAAKYRFGALAELLAVLSLDEDKAEVPAALQRSARAFLLLASDARGPYCAACQQQGVVWSGIVVEVQGLSVLRCSRLDVAR